MPRTPIHPGEHLAEELRELGITAAELSRQIAALPRRAGRPRGKFGTKSP
jgi:plasmid maintenance system antidote protein VapI